MKIRKATLQDIPSIQQIARKTWPTAYANVLTPGQVEFMLDESYHTDILSALLEAGHHFVLLHDDGDVPVGFAGFETDYEGSSAKLHKLYLLPSVQRKGYGQTLLDAIVQECQAAGQQRILVNVNRRNTAAEFYKKRGFTLVEEVDIPIGNGYFMNDYVLELALDQI